MVVGAEKQPHMCRQARRVLPLSIMIAPDCPVLLRENERPCSGSTDTRDTQHQKCIFRNDPRNMVILSFMKFSKHPFTFLIFLNIHGDSWFGGESRAAALTWLSVHTKQRGFHDAGAFMKR